MISTKKRLRELASERRASLRILKSMAAMIEGGLDISPVITHRFPIDDFRQGFEVMGSGKSGKVLLDWGVK